MSPSLMKDVIRHELEDALWRPMTAPRSRARTRNEAGAGSARLSEDCAKAAQFGEVCAKARNLSKTAPKRRRLAPAIDIQVASSLWQAQPQAEQTVRAAIAAAAALSTAEGEVSILLTDDKAIRALKSRLARNRQADQRAVVSGAGCDARRTPSDARRHRHGL